jgi:hypothetical protein
MRLASLMHVLWLANVYPSWRSSLSQQTTNQGGRPEWCRATSLEAGEVYHAAGIRGWLLYGRTLCRRRPRLSGGCRALPQSLLPRTSSFNFFRVEGQGGLQLTRRKKSCVSDAACSIHISPLLVRRLDSPVGGMGCCRLPGCRITLFAYSFLWVSAHCGIVRSRL